MEAAGAVKCHEKGCKVCDLGAQSSTALIKKHSHCTYSDTECLLRMPVGVIDVTDQLSQLLAVHLRLHGFLCTLRIIIQSDGVCVNLVAKHSILGAKDTIQSLWETLAGLLKKCSCHKKRCGHVGFAAV